MLFILMFTAFIAIQAQVVFKTIVTQGPVVVNESFQVQYVLENLDKEDEFFPPDFKDFRFVSGPNVYIGSSYGIDGAKKLKNIIYTLMATKPGKFIIPGAAARVGDNYIKSGNARLEVISKSKAYRQGIALDNAEPDQDYFLSPGEDPYEKMRRNLFMKVMVDKRTCFVGEPVTAVFKLYSRLESKSDIVKNPGFYGFTVQDMVSLDNKLTNTEIINGKKFDVHVVRKVQLYPLQAGLFSIDAMEVQNKVEFSKSAVNKKTEQEIVEGVFPHNQSVETGNTVSFENSMSTEPVAITVKPTPQKNKPAEYNGATGRFLIAASLRKEELAKNEEGDLIIIISGRGNFTQLSPPAIQWPAGIEGFEPVIKDSLSHDHSPLTGKREFHFRFVSTKPGSYLLRAVSFSFFDPDSNHYKTIATHSMNVSISNNEKISGAASTKSNEIAKPASKTWWLAGSFILAGILIIIFWLRKTKRRIKPATVVEKINTPVSVAELLKPASTFSAADDKTFYSILRNCIWIFFTGHFDLTGSQMNKFALSAMMQQKKIDERSREAILEILSRCETGIFTSVEDAGDKKKLLEETKEVLEKISNQMQ